MPKSKKKNKVEKPIARANLSQNLDQRESVPKDKNHRHGIDPS